MAAKDRSKPIEPWLIVIAASAGGIQALRQILAALRDHLPIAPYTIYVARPDFHLTISPTKRFSYVDGMRVRGVRSSANPLFASAASAFRDRVVAVVLTGGGMDATDGVQAVKAHGGIVIAQDESTAEQFSMPHSAIKTGAVDYVLPIGTIAPMLAAIVEGHAMHETPPG